MSEDPKNRSRNEGPEYDDWPIEGRSQENVEWLGFVGGTEQGAPALYDTHDDAVYRGTLDEKNERIVPNLETERRVSSEETIGEVLRDIADSHGWQSLSNFAAEHLGGDAEADENGNGIGTDRERAFAHSEFHERNVGASADHQRGFFGAVTYEGEGRVYTIEHEFHVYTESNRRENGKPTAEVEERRLRTETVEEGRRGGDAELVDGNRHEFVVDIDPERGERMEAEEIEAYCREWHEEAVRSSS